MASSSTRIAASCLLRQRVPRPTAPYESTLVRALSSYAETKKAEKLKRTERFRQAQERLARQKTRRDGKPKDELKNAFREWFDKKRVYQEIMNRKAKQAKMEWDIEVAAVVERLPVVTPDKPDWERDYIDLKTYLMQFGKEYPRELGMPEPGDMPLTEEDLLAMLPEGFTPAPRVTKADETGDVKTRDRRLATRVYLTVLPGTTNDKNLKWGFPTVAVAAEETLLEAAKRAVKDSVGSTLELYCPSNCPIAVDLKVYSEEERKEKGTYGTTTFFMKVQHDEGDVATSNVNNPVQDYAWLERSEMTERVKEERGEHASKFYHYLL